MPHEKISFRALNIATERCGAVLSDEKVLQREKVLQGGAPRFEERVYDLLEGRRSFTAATFFYLEVLVRYGVLLLKEANEMWFISD